MELIHQELERIESSGELTDEFLYVLEVVALTLNGLKEDGE
jgi:hypothetical protein